MLKNLKKKPGPIFALPPLKKVYLQTLKETWPNFWLTTFKKGILTNLQKKPGPIFCLLAFSNIKKSVLTNLEKNQFQFFADQVFEILKKVYLQILKKHRPIVY